MNLRSIAPSFFTPSAASNTPSSASNSNQQPQTPQQQVARPGMTDAAHGWHGKALLEPQVAATASAKLREGQVIFGQGQRIGLDGVKDFLDGHPFSVATPDYVIHCDKPEELAWRSGPLPLKCTFIYDENRDYKYSRDRYRQPSPPHLWFQDVISWHRTCEAESWQYNTQERSEAQVMVGPPAVGDNALEVLARRVQAAGQPEHT